jgi:hypothetical protein
MPDVTASASALTRGTFSASAGVTALTRGTFAVVAGVTALVSDRSRVGLARAPSITDPTKVALNFTLNAAYNRIGRSPEGVEISRPGWTALGPGPVARFEFGQGGAIRTITSVAVTPSAEGDALNWLPGLGNSTYEALGSFVRRDGTASMGGALLHADPATNTTQGQLGWLSGWYGLTASTGNDLRLAAPDTKKVQFRTNDIERGYFNNSGLTVVGTLDVSGLATLSGGVSVTGAVTASGLGGFGNLRAGNHPVLGSTDPGIWNSANILATNYALVAEASNTLVNATTTLALQNGGSTILSVVSGGITLASGKIVTVPGATVRVLLQRARQSKPN